MSAFSDDVQHLLTEAGWYEGRRVSTVAYRQETLRRQLPWLPAAERILREFGGLHCYFSRHDHSVARIQFDVQQAADLLDLHDLHTRYAPRIPGRLLGVVGQAYTDPLCLLVDSHGTFYGACAAGLYHIADAAPQALEAILLDLPFREV